MYFYKNRLPVEQTIVVAQIITDSDSDTCIYASLPEYNGHMGIIQKSELPKRVKIQKKTVSDMKHASYIVCTVMNNPVFDKEGMAEMIELSTKGVDTKYHEDVITRFKNIERIIKLIKFISIEFKINYNEMIQKFHNDDIIAISVINEDTGVNNYNELYHNYLINCDTVLNKITDIITDKFSDIHNKLKSLIKETNASTFLDFDIAIWGADRDAVFVLRDLYIYIDKTYKDIEIKYVGAPTYQIIIKSIKFEQIDEYYNNIHNDIINWLKENNVKGYDLKLDCSMKQVKRGDVSITYPYKID